MFHFEEGRSTIPYVGLSPINPLKIILNVLGCKSVTIVFKPFTSLKLKYFNENYSSHLIKTFSKVVKNPYNTANFTDLLQTKKFIVLSIYITNTLALPGS